MDSPGVGDYKLGRELLDPKAGAHFGTATKDLQPSAALTLPFSHIFTGTTHPTSLLRSKVRRSHHQGDGAQWSWPQVQRDADGVPCDSSLLHRVLEAATPEQAHWWPWTR